MAVLQSTVVQRVDDVYIIKSENAVKKANNAKPIHKIVIYPGLLCNALWFLFYLVRISKVFSGKNLEIKLPEKWKLRACDIAHTAEKHRTAKAKFAFKPSDWLYEDKISLAVLHLQTNLRVLENIE